MLTRHSYTHKVPITSLKRDAQKKAWLLRVTKATGWSLRAMSWPATNLSLELILYNDRVFFFCWATTNWRIKGKRWYYNEHSLSLSVSLSSYITVKWLGQFHIIHTIAQNLIIMITATVKYFTFVGLSLASMTYKSQKNYAIKIKWKNFQKLSRK